MANEQNLIPAKKGEIRNPKGKAKGTKNLSTIIKKIGNDIDWDKTTLKNKDEVKNKYGNRGWEALVYVAFTRGMAGDIKAMDWLAKHGYDDKMSVDHTSSDGSMSLSDKLTAYLDGNMPNTKE